MPRNPEKDEYSGKQTWKTREGAARVYNSPRAQNQKTTPARSGDLDRRGAPGTSRLVLPVLPTDRSSSDFEDHLCEMLGPHYGKCTW